MDRPDHVPERLPLHGANGLDLSRHRCCAGPSHKPFDEQHQAFSISYVEYGVFEYRSMRGRAELGPGWVLLGNDGEHYVCSHEHNDGRGDSCIVLSFSGDVLESLQRALGLAGQPRLQQPALAPVPRLTALFAALAVASAEGVALDQACLAAATAVLEQASGARARASRSDDARAHAAARFIERHAADPLTLDAIAGHVALSPFHFVRAFRAAIGVTPHQYLIRVRLMRAIALLRDTRLPVTRIAYESGWSDLSTFNRTFRREIGCTPRDFRCGRYDRTSAIPKVESRS